LTFRVRVHAAFGENWTRQVLVSTGARVFSEWVAECAVQERSVPIKLAQYGYNHYSPVQNTAANLIALVHSRLDQDGNLKLHSTNANFIL
jgi:hypothetical protein